MNNYIFQDPLLYNSVPQANYNNQDLKRQVDDVVRQYQTLQNMQPPTPPAHIQEQTVEDHLGKLDIIIQNLGEETLAILNSNQEFISLNNAIQQLIQEEIIKTVKWKINSNSEAVKKIERLKDICETTRRDKENIDKRNMAELNDYIKNYGDLTFNEYQQLKHNTK